MGGVSSPIPSPVTDTISAPISRRRYAEQITGPPPGYTWLLFNGQKVYFNNGEPVYVKEST